MDHHWLVVKRYFQNLRQILTGCPMKHLVSTESWLITGINIISNMNMLNDLFWASSRLPQRESGLQVFQLFINKLDTEAKHKFFRWENQYKKSLYVKYFFYEVMEMFIIFIKRKYFKPFIVLILIIMVYRVTVTCSCIYLDK